MQPPKQRACVLENEVLRDVRRLCAACTVRFLIEMKKMKKKRVSIYEEPKPSVSLLSRRYRLSIPMDSKNFYIDAEITSTGNISLINRYDNTNIFVFRNSDKRTIWAIAKLMIEATKIDDVKERMVK